MVFSAEKWIISLGHGSHDHPKLFMEIIELHYEILILFLGFHIIDELRIKQKEDVPTC